MNDVVNTGGLDVGERAAGRPFRGTASIVGAVAAIVVVLFGFLAFLHEASGVDVRVLLRDPAETADIPEYAGAYMYAGVLLLWTAGVVSALAGLAARHQPSDPRMARFRFGLGVFLCWLAADDLLMIHEWLGLGLSRVIGIENEYLGRTRLEGIVFLVYGIVAITGLWRYRADIGQSEPALLLVAVGCFGLSAGVDVGGALLDDTFAAGSPREMVRTYAEEMLKFAGVLFVFVYALRSARVTVWAVSPNIL